MTAPLMTSFIAALKPFDAAALSEPLSLDVQHALTQDPLLKKTLFVDGCLDMNLWRALLWASQRMGAVRLLWPVSSRESQHQLSVLNPLYSASTHGVDLSPRFKRDALGRIDDNLIIHGENLSVLSTLSGDYSNRIKLCYIDPPYGTGSGDFAYKDRFGAGQWLEFMSRRIAALKPLLTPDGIVIVQCSFHHQAHLEAMLKSHFINHLCTLHLQVRHPKRILTGDKQFNDIIEHALVFSPDATATMPKQKESRTMDDYIFKIEPLRISRSIDLNGRNVQVYEPGDYRIVKGEPGANGLKKISIRGTIREKNNSGRIYVRSIEPIASTYPAMTLFKYPGIGADGLGFRYFYTPAAYGQHGKRRKNGGYFQGVPLGEGVVEKPFPNFMDWTADYNRVRSEGGVDLRNGKKPERLMRFLIEGFTDPGEWVLDYHLGSGTTCAVSHKLGRRYIGIEEMEYAEAKSAHRIKRVIGLPSVDDSGISKSVNWKGGGRFVFCRAMAPD